MVSARVPSHFKRSLHIVADDNGGEGCFTSLGMRSMPAKSRQVATVSRGTIGLG